MPCLVPMEKKVENSSMKALYFEVRTSGLKVAEHKKVSEVFLFIFYPEAEETRLWCLAGSMFPPQRRTQTVLPLMVSFISLAAARASPAEPSTTAPWWLWRNLTAH